MEEFRKVLECVGRRRLPRRRPVLLPRQLRLPPSVFRPRPRPSPRQWRPRPSVMPASAHLDHCLPVRPVLQFLHVLPGEISIPRVGALLHCLMTTLDRGLSRPRRAPILGGCLLLLVAPTQARLAPPPPSAPFDPSVVRSPSFLVTDTRATPGSHPFGAYADPTGRRLTWTNPYGQAGPHFDSTRWQADSADHPAGGAGFRTGP